MGRWTPLVLMAGGLAILMGTLLGINFPMGEGQKVSSNTPGDKASKVLPANINVNSSAPNKSGSNTTTSENRNNVAQEDFNTNDNASDNASEERGNVTQEDRRSTSRTSVAQSNATNESFSSSDDNNTSENTSSSNTNREPIRALW
ncbi:hypothetical protein [Anabaena sp. UHCC 0399]|uniref:hypothetical protein n=1 Tax=Anabaena sp. UHCC 0399 TaxID=3110238 RepID=UPI001685B04C|nr:hypothetical protein [Anabaena sp. UHCC 0399]MBD2362397.1 hypothetical protein [Anabaena minutissima FACHB-250]MEA5564749.1 hypothetical protein [Anabaena sp. UHCC 0399]